MKGIFFITCIIVISFYYCEGINNYLQDPLYPCIRCLCHARSGCWRRQNCARYSISKSYWEEAGSLQPNFATKSTDNYQECMKDENCIVGTIINYTEKFGRLDCNCDGKFDCKDRFAIHLFGRKCGNPKFSSTYARRFNDCATDIGVFGMQAEEGAGTCGEPDIV